MKSPGDTDITSVSGGLVRRLLSTQALPLNWTSSNPLEARSRWVTGVTSGWGCSEQHRTLQFAEGEEMNVRLHAHARDRLVERGATEAEVTTTVTQGERFGAKFGRVGFRRNFVFDGRWRGRFYGTKQVEAYAVEEQAGWLVITVIVKYFGEREIAP